MKVLCPLYYFSWKLWEDGAILFLGVGIWVKLCVRRTSLRHRWKTSGRDGHYDSEVRYFILGSGYDCSISKENLQSSNAADVRKRTVVNAECNEK